MIMSIKIFKPRFSKRELLIIKQCCSNTVRSMEKFESSNTLDDFSKSIKEDLHKILKKLN